MGIGNVSKVKNAWTCFRIRGLIVCRLLRLWPYATQIAYIFRFGWLRAFETLFWCPELRSRMSHDLQDFPNWGTYTRSRSRRMNTVQSAGGTWSQGCRPFGNIDPWFWSMPRFIWNFGGFWTLFICFGHYICTRNGDSCRIFSPEIGWNLGLSIHILFESIL